MNDIKIIKYIKNNKDEHDADNWAFYAHLLKVRLFCKIILLVRWTRFASIKNRIFRKWYWKFVTFF